MNFFRQQELARRNTRTMLLLYALAVIAVVAAVDAALGIAWSWGMSETSRSAPVPGALYLIGAAGTLGVIFIASLYHVLRLREGGEAIARMVGAQRVAPDTRDLLERRLLNVVEEMSIAAGVRVPAVYVMQDEQGINAFAAGYDVSNSVVAVTRGTLQTLNRDELQGVIGHEFSHIVNGDMGLNIRMMGVLGGILFIGAIGEFLMRSSGGSRRSSKDSGSGGVFLFGLALLAIGYIGVLFARLIKAAVSRQREFLADAASVQFTRNPAGIAGALDQIRTSQAGTLVMNRYAEDLSHMFFGQSVKLRLAGLFDTHPPLDERIRRVVPDFGADEYRARRASAQALADAQAAAPVAASGKRAGDHAYAWGRSVAQSVALVGTLDAGKVAQARRLIDRLPQALQHAARQPGAAPAVVIATMLAEPQAVMEQQLAAVAAAGASALGHAARPFAAEASRLSPALRLPLVDLALPALKQAPAEEKQKFLEALEAVIRADRRISLHEFVVLTLVRAQLQPKPLSSARKSISELKADAVLMLSLFAQAGRSGPQGAEGAEPAFRAGERELGLSGSTLAPAAALTYPAIEQALDRLRALALLAKSELMGALFAAVTFDGKVKIAEAELMRLAGGVLGCPLPPLIEEADPV